MQQLQAAIGLIGLFALAWCLGERRREARLRVVVVGITVQLAMAALLLKVEPVRRVFTLLNDAVAALQSASEAGTGFVFGYLGGGPLPFEESSPGASFVLAFRALPLILLLSALTALLTHWKVLPWLVRVFAAGLQRTLGLGGATSLAVAANVFLGMVEAPLFIRAYLERLPRSELFVLMTAGMATIAGTVLVLYATVLAPVLPDAAGHLLTASLISAPAAVAIARTMVPAGFEPGPAAELAAAPAHGAMDALMRGVESGVRLVISVTATLIVLVALVHLVNAGLAALPQVGGAPIALERVLGWLMAPLAWMMGVPWSEAPQAGQLLGVKTVLNELIAYLQLASLPADALSPTTRLILTYALCGFANPGSLGILIAGLATLAPGRRDEVIALGARSVVAGTLATCSTGAVVALVGT